MKACGEHVNQLWPKQEDRNVELKIGYRAGWKDALEWILWKNENLIIKQGMVFGRDIERLIKKELDNESI